MDFTAESHPGWCDPQHCTPGQHSSTPVSHSVAGTNLTFSCTRLAGTLQPAIQVRITTPTGDVTLALPPHDAQWVADRLKTELGRLRYLTAPRTGWVAVPVPGDAA